jgi:low affinity Fe/Cu permease
MNEWFRKAAARIACALGSSWVFAGAALLVALWLASGPYFDYGNGWQLFINTTTSIGTFLMIFVVQNSQNRDTKAINIKLDELLRAIEGARTRLANVGELSDEELERLEGEFRRLASEDDARAVAGRSPRPTVGVPEPNRHGKATRESHPPARAGACGWR